MSESIVIKNLTKKFTFSVKNKSSGWFRNLFFPEKREIIAVDDTDATQKAICIIADDDRRNSSCFSHLSILEQMRLP